MTMLQLLLLSLIDMFSILSFLDVVLNVEMSGGCSLLTFPDSLVLLEILDPPIVLWLFEEHSYWEMGLLSWLSYTLNMIKPLLLTLHHILRILGLKQHRRLKEFICALFWR